MFTKLKSHPKILLTLSIALAIVTIASASLVSRSSRQAFVPGLSRAAAFPVPCIDSFTVGSTGSTGSLNLTVKLQDVPYTINNVPQTPIRTTIPLRVKLRPATGTDLTFFPTATYYVAPGTTLDQTWTTTISSIPPGAYTLLVKGPSHYQTNYGQIDISTNGTLLKNVTATPLRGGDIACGIDSPTGTCPLGDPDGADGFNDNYVELSDLSKSRIEFNITSITTSLADINLDGYVDLTDISRILINVGLAVPGDQ